MFDSTHTEKQLPVEIQAVLITFRHRLLNLVQYSIWKETSWTQPWPAACWWRIHSEQAAALWVCKLRLPAWAVLDSSHAVQVTWWSHGQYVTRATVHFADAAPSAEGNFAWSRKTRRHSAAHTIKKYGPLVDKMRKERSTQLVHYLYGMQLIYPVWILH